MYRGARQTVKHQLRNEARECLSRAKELLAKGDEASARYACLELRFAIEFIVYDQLQTYLTEVPDSTVRKWKPRELIAAMLEVDPHADQTVTIAVGIEETPGVEAKEMLVIGTDQRFTSQEAHKLHMALGNFLHAPTLHQIETGERQSCNAIPKKATEVAEIVERVLSSRVFNVRFAGYFYEIPCECGLRIRRAAGSFTGTTGIPCPNSKCGAVYDVSFEDGRVVGFTPRQTSYECSECHATNEVPIHKVIDGAVLTCSSCGDQRRLKRIYRLVPPDKSPGDVVTTGS